MQITLNSQVITYNNIYYVSASGDDITGDGTKDKPFKSYDKAFSKSLSGDLIYFIKGTYNITTVINGDSYSGAFIYDRDKQLTIYAEPYTYIIMNNPSNLFRDTHIFTTYNDNTKVIGFTIDYYVSDNRAVYGRSIFGSTDYPIRGTVYNCHFIIRCKISFSYANNSNIAKMINCQFDLKNGTENSYSGHTSFQNCAFNINKINMDPYYIDLGGNTWSSTLTYDSKYKMNPIIENCGIFYGLYKWGIPLLLIIDGSNIENISGTDIIIKDVLPLTSDKFTSYGMENLSLFNTTVISKIQSEKYKIAVLKK